MTNTPSPGAHKGKEDWGLARKVWREMMEMEDAGGGKRQGREREERKKLCEKKRI